VVELKRFEEYVDGTFCSVFLDSLSLFSTGKSENLKVEFRYFFFVHSEKSSSEIVFESLVHHQQDGVTAADRTRQHLLEQIVHFFLVHDLHKGQIKLFEHGELNFEVDQFIVHQQHVHADVVAEFVLEFADQVFFDFFVLLFDFFVADWNVYTVVFVFMYGIILVIEITNFVIIFRITNDTSITITWLIVLRNHDRIYWRVIVTYLLGENFTFVIFAIFGFCVFNTIVQVAVTAVQ